MAKVKNRTFTVIKKTACLLAGGLLLAGMPLPAAAADMYSYTVLEDGTIAVTCTDTAIVNAEIPAEIDNYTVSALSEECFSGCGSLQSVSFPDSVTQISDYAFHDCTALKTIVIPETVTEIGDFVFEGCTSLTAVLVAEGSEYFAEDGGVLYDADMEVLIRYPAAKAEISYTVPDSCTAIAPWAFTDCSNLQSISMQNVTSIGADAFFCASSLQTAELPEGLTELIGASFAYCVNLQSITLPSTLQTIGDKCFYGCVSLLSVDLPEGLTNIGERAFYGCVQMKEMEISSSVTSIGEMGVGYSVDPDTGESIVIEGFRLKTVSNSQAQKYARNNHITCDASLSRSMALLICLLIAAVLLACVFGYLAYRKKAESAKALERERLEKKKAAGRRRHPRG